MPELIIIVIVAAVAAAFGSLYLRLRRLNAAAERALMEARRALDDARRSREQAVLEKENIVGEERRMFQFLEHMGTALAVNSQDPAALYEMIATGTAKVVDAPESCLYIRDRRTSMLVPVYLSPRCPPLIALPEHLRGGGDEAGIGSYLRLASVPMDYGIFGRTFLDGQDGGVQQVPNVALDRAAQDWPAAQPHRGVGALVAPLYYQDRKLGILAVCRPPGARPFSENDIDVFGSVAQQSGFTLGNAVLFQDATDKRRYEQELRTARDIQKILLPSHAPEVEGYSFAGVNRPAAMVSGDYFDFVNVDSTHEGIVIADVSGKGIAASLVTAMCRSVLRANAARSHSPAKVLRAVNRLIFPDIREDMFISVAYVIVDSESDEITLARAGHNPPLLYRAADQTAIEVNPPGIAVGFDAGPVFKRVVKDTTVKLSSGDCLLLFTDGVTEARNPEGDEFGDARLRDTFIELGAKGADAIVEGIIAAVRKFTGLEPQNDDITLIAVEKR